MTDRADHGTGTCSVLVGRRLGVAPGAELQVYPVLDAHGQGDIQHLAATMASMQPADIVCLPFAFAAKTPGEERLRHEIQKLSRQGVLIIAAGPIEDKNILPSVYPEVLCAGAATPQGRPAPFSRDHRSVRFEGSARRIPDIYGYGVEIPVARRRATKYAPAPRSPRPMWQVSPRYMPRVDCAASFSGGTFSIGWARMESPAISSPSSGKSEIAGCWLSSCVARSPIANPEPHQNSTD